MPTSGIFFALVILFGYASGGPVEDICLPTPISDPLQFSLVTNVSYSICANNTYCKLAFYLDHYGSDYYVFGKLMDQFILYYDTFNYPVNLTDIIVHGFCDDRIRSLWVMLLGQHQFCHSANMIYVIDYGCRCADGKHCVELDVSSNSLALDIIKIILEVVIAILIIIYLNMKLTGRTPDVTTLPTNSIAVTAPVSNTNGKRQQPPANVTTTTAPARINRRQVNSRTRQAQSTTQISRPPRRTDSFNMTQVLDENDAMYFGVSGDDDNDNSD